MQIDSANNDVTAGVQKLAVIAWVCISIACFAGFHLYDPLVDKTLRIIVWVSLPLLGLAAVTRMRFIQNQRTRKIVQLTLGIPLGIFAVLLALVLTDPGQQTSVLERRDLANGATLLRIETTDLGGGATVRDSSSTDLEYRYPVFPHLIYWSNSIEIDHFPPR